MKRTLFLVLLLTGFCAAQIYAGKDKPSKKVVAVYGTSDEHSSRRLKLYADSTYLDESYAMALFIPSHSATAGHYLLLDSSLILIRRPNSRKQRKKNLYLADTFRIYNGCIQLYSERLCSS